MNPHDPRERPRTHRVAEMFGVDDPWELSDKQPVGSALDLIGRTVAESARDVDELHSALIQAAQSAISALTPIARGDIAGMGEQGSPLHITGPEIGLLLARRASASVQLTRALSSYQRLRLRFRRESRFSCPESRGQAVGRAAASAERRLGYLR